jgi:hypothetical protein
VRSIDREVVPRHCGVEISFLAIISCRYSVDASIEGSRAVSSDVRVPCCSFTPVVNFSQFPSRSILSTKSGGVEAFRLWSRPVAAPPC